MWLNYSRSRITRSTWALESCPIFHDRRQRFELGRCNLVPTSRLSRKCQRLHPPYTKIVSEASIWQSCSRNKEGIAFCSTGWPTRLRLFWCYGGLHRVTFRWEILYCTICQRDISDGILNCFYLVSSSHYHLGMDGKVGSGGYITNWFAWWGKSQRPIGQEGQDTTVTTCKMSQKFTDYECICTSQD